MRGWGKREYEELHTEVASSEARDHSEIVVGRPGSAETAEHERGRINEGAIGPCEERKRRRQILLNSR